MFSFSFYLFSSLLAYFDFKYFKVPNVLVSTLFILLLFFGFVEQQLNIYSFAIAISVLLFFVALLLLQPKMVLGGGDIKYIILVALYLEPLVFPYFLIITGILQSILLVIKQKVFKRRTAPMVPVIFLSVIICDILVYYHMIRIGV